MTLAMWLAFAGGAIFGGTCGAVVMSALAARRIGQAYDRGRDDGVRRLSDEMRRRLPWLADERG